MTTNSQTFSTESGRKIQVIEAGQPDGMPVLVHHGTPGSNLFINLGLRMHVHRV